MIIKVASYSYVICFASPFAVVTIDIWRKEGGDALEICVSVVPFYNSII